jgi:hypothetical protein
MKTKLEDINIIPDFAKINPMTENDAKCALYGMAALAASMAFELYIKEKYYKKPDGLESDYTDLLLKRFEDAASEIGILCVAPKEGEIK